MKKIIIFVVLMMILAGCQKSMFVLRSECKEAEIEQEDCHSHCLNTLLSCKIGCLYGLNKYAIYAEDTTWNHALGMKAMVDCEDFCEEKMRC